MTANVRFVAGARHHEVVGSGRASDRRHAARLRTTDQRRLIAASTIVLARHGSLDPDPAQPPASGGDRRRCRPWLVLARLSA
jgi:hypothetical protein